MMANQHLLSLTLKFYTVQFLTWLFLSNRMSAKDQAHIISTVNVQDGFEFSTILNSKVKTNFSNEVKTEAYKNKMLERRI